MVELLLRGRVVDGSAAPAHQGWVAVDAGRVVAVGRDGQAEPAAGRVVERPSWVVAPGFVDVHSHADLTAVVAPGLAAAVAQGVTTVVIGNCGLSPAPLAARATAAQVLEQWLGTAPPEAPDVAWAGFGEFLDVVAQASPAVNVVALAGFGALRRAAVADTSRPARPDETRRMRDLLARCLDEGAAGLSSGLIYDPDRSATTEELVAVAGAVRGRGRYASHVRGEGRLLWQAVDEALAVGRRAGVPVQVSHLKLEGRSMWGGAGELLARLRRARAEGLEVGADHYPYTAYETSLAAFFPAWAQPPGLATLLARPGERSRLRHAVDHGEADWQSSVDDVGWDRVVLTRHRDAGVVGLTVAQAAAGSDPFAAACELLLADPECAVVGHAMAEDDVRTLVAAPDVAVCTDSAAAPADGPLAGVEGHPRGWGAFPRVLGRYVRDEGLLTLEAAVARMTSLPADQFGLGGPGGRGRLQPGAVADVVLLDPDAVVDRADHVEPRRPPVGIELVLVAGRPAHDPQGLVGPVGRHGVVLR
jgi:dihydroorotase/N-acyl-D-amino-acid deacylase